MLFSVHSAYVHIWAQDNVSKLRVDDFAKVQALAQKKAAGKSSSCAHPPSDTVQNFLFYNDSDIPYLDVVKINLVYLPTT